MPSSTLEHDIAGKNYQHFIAHAATEDVKSVILIAPTWAGRDNFVCDKATELAQHGYTSLALDLYGDAAVGVSNEENTSLMTPLISDRDQLQALLTEILHTISKQAFAKDMPILAIGYCFGGLCVLDMARVGLPLAGVVSIHGLMTPPENLEIQAITSPILALHGYQDPMVPPEQLHAFNQEMLKAEANWEVCVYGQARHAFTNPIANDHELGTVYHQQTSQRAWNRMLNFIADCVSSE